MCEPPSAAQVLVQSTFYVFLRSDLCYTPKHDLVDGAICENDLSAGKIESCGICLEEVVLPDFLKEDEVAQQIEKPATALRCLRSHWWPLPR